MRNQRILPTIMKDIAIAVLFPLYNASADMEFPDPCKISLKQEIDGGV